MTAINDHFSDVEYAIDFAKTESPALAQVADLIETAALILVCGNGGSAATAIHFASDLRSLGYLAFDLLSPSKVTQIGNDVGYGNIFLDQTALLDALVIAFSGSGTSKNVVALAYALGDRLILFTSDMLEVEYPGVLLTIRAASTDYEVVEDVHMAMCHAIKKELKARAQ